MRRILPAAVVSLLATLATSSAQSDPAERDLKPLDGRVKRDDTKPGRPVVEVRLFGANVTDDDFKALAGFDQLRRFQAGSTKFTGTGFKHLAKLPIEELHLSFTGVTDDGLKEIAGIRTLKVLDLTNASKITDDGLPALAALENMEELSVGQNFRVKDVGLAKAVTGMKKLRKLHVANSSAGDGAMKAVAVSNPDLRVLSIYSSNVTDAGLKHVGSLKNLEELHAAADITDKGIPALAGLEKLKRLDVYNTQVSYAALRASPLLPRLEVLRFGGPLCDITKEQADVLRAAAPNCNIKTK